MRKKLLKGILVSSIMLQLVGCAQYIPGAEANVNNQNRDLELRESLELFGMTTEECQVVIPGLTQEYTFLYLSDLHIIVENEQIAETSKEDVHLRWQAFQNTTGIKAADLWTSLPEILDEYGADAILLGGDMLDYISDSNMECLKTGLDSLQTPYMYVKADHDYATWYNDLTQDDAKRLQSQLGELEEVSLIEYPDLCIVGIDNNTSQLTATALAEFEAIYAKNKPILMMTHVPFVSLVDESLSELSKLVWGDRILAWGQNAYYVPDANTKALMNRIYEEDSLVKQVFSGHLHFTWDGALTEDTRQYVFDAAYKGSVGIIRVSGNHQAQ